MRQTRHQEGYKVLNIDTPADKGMVEGCTKTKK